MTGELPARLRQRLRDDLPASTFEARPLRVLWFVPLVVSAGVGMSILARVGTGVATTVGACVLVGNAYASMMLLAHEVMHGATVRSRSLQYALAWLGMAPFFVSPSLWRVWHNEVHHAHTNEFDRDPDIFAGEALHASSPSSRLVLRVVPGSAGVLSLLFPFFWFCAHGQIVLWYLSRRMSGFERLRRRRAEVELAVMVLGWVALAVTIGLDRAPLAILAPMAVGNCLLMSYIATNHLLRPLVAESDPLRSSMSVRTLPLLDRLHFRFSHHVEHHLFPSMSGAGLPRVRSWLLRHVPDEYVCPSHARALVWLYKTPRTYRDATMLVDPRRPFRDPVDLDRLAAVLSSVRARRRGDQGPTSPSADKA
jgi:fatty acid desaturase